MYHNNDYEGSGYPGTGPDRPEPVNDWQNAPHTPEGSYNIPQKPVNDWQNAQHTPESAYNRPQQPAPAERMDAYVFNTNPSSQRMISTSPHESGVEIVFKPETVDWSEPLYSQTHESTSTMYTPGICVDSPFPRKRNADPNFLQKRRERGRKIGRFIRAVCLLIACTMMSGAAAYWVMDYRFERGDFTIVEERQVVLGGSHNQQGGNLAYPVSVSGVSMPPEDIYDMALAHVVGIKTELANSGGSSSSQSSTTIVSGTGFIISNDGYILTNYHVIETADQNGLPIIVHLYDGTTYEAEVIGYESNNDFAVIKIDAKGLIPAVIGNSDNVRVGQRVYAVGNPFGDLVYTMTDGIVSALDRVVTVEGKSINMFQFSAAVNSGNSGGPVYDSYGEVIGIVTAKWRRESVEGIGFAIPINDAIQTAADLIEHGYITGRPLMGITVETVTPGQADYLEWVVGAYIRSVLPDSAAETAGLQVGDIITKLGDAEVNSLDSLLFTLRRYRAGDTVTVTVWRGGEEIEMVITFDENLSAGQPLRP